MPPPTSLVTPRTPRYTSEVTRDSGRATGATSYISGPAAKSYLEESRFTAAGLKLVWKDYTGYPEYPQRHPPFEPAVSIIDLLFNTGPEAPHYIWGWRESRS